MTTEKQPPTQAEIQSYLVRSTSELLRSGAGVFLKEHSALENQVLDDNEFDSHDKMKKNLDNFYYSELPIAVLRHDLEDGTAELAICKVNSEGEAVDDDASVVVLDQEGVIDLDYKFFSRGNKDLVDKVIELDQIQAEMEWQPTYTGLRSDRK